MRAVGDFHVSLSANPSLSQEIAGKERLLESRDAGFWGLGRDEWGVAECEAWGSCKVCMCLATEGSQAHRAAMLGLGPRATGSQPCVPASPRSRAGNDVPQVTQTADVSRS